jgi:hypothetical protein
MPRLTASELMKVPFPECVSKCALVEVLGVCECAAACPMKFDNTGNPIDGEKLSQESNNVPPRID